MARWAKDKKKPSNEARPITGGVVSASEAEAAVAVAVARTGTKPLPTPDPSQAERTTQLENLQGDGEAGVLCGGVHIRRQFQM